MIFLSTEMAALQLDAYIYAYIKTPETDPGSRFSVFPNAKSTFLPTTFKLTH